MNAYLTSCATQMPTNFEVKHAIYPKLGISPNPPIIACKNAFEGCLFKCKPFWNSKIKILRILESKPSFWLSQLLFLKTLAKL